ncbi:MAG: carbohydrate binding family 9 domain-containing protein [Myxococcota bacterium]
MLYRLLSGALAAGLAGSALAAEPTSADSAHPRQHIADRLSRQLRELEGQQPPLARPARAAWELPSATPALEAPGRDPASTAQVPAPSTAEGGELRRPFLRAARTDVPPTIDGRLTDEVWALGTPIRDLFVDEPVEGDPLPQRTEIRVLYDDQALYFAAWCYDTEPDKITASVMRRDANIRNQDYIMVLFDPFGERRSGYVFAVNPRSSRWDALIEEAGGINQEWDGIWYAQARRSREGWVVEIAIPFKSLNFPAGRKTWGFNIARGISRYNQFGRWAFPLQHAFLFDPGYFGDLGGLEGLEQGLGIDAVPSLALRQVRNNSESRVNEESDPSFDLFYKITPSLTSVLTVNTDFSEAEPDKRRANLTRFSLFFPEQRDFFLQDAGIFSFADFGFRGSNTDPKVNGQPFFSRRIALDETGPLSLRIGGKTTGRIGPLNLGVLATRVEGHGDVDGKWLSVARGYLNVLDESRLGFITTYGSPDANEHYKLFGADFNYRSSTFLGNKILEGTLWAQKTSSPDSNDRDAALGASLAYPNDRWNWEVSALEIQERFNPALGFANRRDIRAYRAALKRRFRPGGAIRLVDVGGDAELVTATDNDFESLTVNVDLFFLETEIGDEFRVRAIYRREDLLADFAIREGIVIPKEHYRFDRYKVKLDTSRHRQAEITVELEYGQFFTGTRFDILTSFEYRPSPHFSLLADYEQFHVRLPEGDFTTRIARLGIDVAFSAAVSWRNLIQWDNETDALTVNSRFRWIIEPGREFFVILDPFFFREDRLRLTSTTTELVLKLLWTYRF